MVNKDKPTITNDLVFGHVMQKGDNCLKLVQAILPKLNIKKVKVTAQKIFDEHLKDRGIRLDILAEDEKGRKYDIECQTTDQKDLGERIIYYESKMFGSMLQRGEKFWQIRDVYVIFFCSFDHFHQGAIKYEFESYDKENNLYFPLKRHEIIFNCTGKIDSSLTENLQAFIAYANGTLDQNNSYAVKLNQDVEEYLESSEWEEDKMDLEMTVQEHELSAILRDARGMIQTVREEFHASDKQVLRALQKNYGDILTEEQIERLFKESKKER